MIIKKIVGICPVCDEIISLDSSKVTIEADGDEILLSFTCTECNEDIDREAWELE